MKSVLSEGQMSLSGKAWQIRVLLKQWEKQAAPGISFTEWTRLKLNAGSGRK